MLNQSTPILEIIVKGLKLLQKQSPKVTIDSSDSPEMKIRNEFLIKDYKQTEELLNSINGELSKRRKDEQSE